MATGRVNVKLESLMDNISAASLIRSVRIRILEMFGIKAAVLRLDFSLRDYE